MASPKLQKVNPSFECLFKPHKRNESPTIKVEYTNNTFWEQDIGNINCNELRSELFSKAEQIGEDDDGEEWDASKEDDFEGGNDTVEEEREDPKAKKGAAGKAPAKPAAAKAAPAKGAAKK